MSEHRRVKLEAEEGVATITIDRPDKLNALDRTTIAELGAALRQAQSEDSVRGIVLTGSGSKAFVAGADIGDLAKMGPVEGVEVSRQGQRVFREIELSRKPVIAAVNGLALGGGCELALACHLRVVATTARFGFPEVKLGIIPGYGGNLRLPRLVGLGRALELILTGDMISAEEAFRLGIANRVVDPGALVEESRSLLAKIVANAPLALGMAIECATRGLEMGIEDGLALESNLFGLLASTEDMREGMTAFLEKRPAKFAGR